MTRLRYYIMIYVIILDPKYYARKKMKMIFSSDLIEQQLVINPETRKTFVFDLDGTIVYDGKPLEKRFEHVLLDIKAAGHEVVIATGRSWRDFVPVMPAWCSEQPSVVFGGGLVMVDGTPQVQHFLPSNHLSEIIDFLERNKVNYLLDGHSSYYHPPIEHWLFKDIVKISGQHKSKQVDNVLADGAYKILILDNHWLEHFEEYTKQRELIIKYHFYDKCFDIMPARVNKFSGLSVLPLPDQENIFVFGNDHNDLELMQELPNSILFGHHQELMKYAKVQIEYNEQLFANFAELINCILKKC